MYGEVCVLVYPPPVADACPPAYRLCRIPDLCRKPAPVCINAGGHVENRIKAWITCVIGSLMYALAKSYADARRARLQDLPTRP